jgi:hypothetical protein
MTKKTRNWLIALSILTFPFVLFFGFLIFMEEPLSPLAPLPNPNGYDDFLAAGRMLDLNEYGNYAVNHSNLDLNALSQLVSKSSEALKRARMGLNHDCLTPNNYSPRYILGLATNLPAIKRLAWAFSAEGRLAELEKRTNDAVHIYLDDIRVGQKSCRGGLIIERLVGTAIEAFGMRPLEALTNVSDATLCREVVQTLVSIDETDEPAKNTLQQEDVWRRHSFGLIEQARMMFDFEGKDEAKQELLQRLNETQKQRRTLMINFASRAYELDKGHPPASAADLVPEYLKAVPQDPATGTNMVYSPYLELFTPPCVKLQILNHYQNKL